MGIVIGGGSRMVVVWEKGVKRASYERVVVYKRETAPQNDGKEHS